MSKERRPDDPPLTVGELMQMPQDVTPVFTDSQNGDRRIRSVKDTLSSVEGVRVVRISEYDQ